MLPAFFGGAAFLNCFPIWNPLTWKMNKGWLVFKKQWNLKTLSHLNRSIPHWKPYQKKINLTKGVALKPPSIKINCLLNPPYIKYLHLMLPVFFGGTAFLNCFPIWNPLTWKMNKGWLVFKKQWNLKTLSHLNRSIPHWKPYQKKNQSHKGGSLEASQYQNKLVVKPPYIKYLHLMLPVFFGGTAFLNCFPIWNPLTWKMNKGWLVFKKQWNLKIFLISSVPNFIQPSSWMISGFNIP